MIAALCLAVVLALALGLKGGGRDDAPVAPVSPEPDVTWNLEIPGDEDVTEEIIKNYTDSEVPDEQFQLVQALMMKAGSQDRREDAMAMYADIAKRWRGSKDADLRFEAASAMLRQVELSKSGREKLAILNDVIAAFKLEEREDIWQMVPTAVGVRYALAGDRLWSGALYRDIAMTNGNPRIAAASLFLVGMDSLETVPNRIRTYDGLIERFGGNPATADIVDKALFARAQLVPDTEEKIAAYSRWVDNADAEGRETRAQAVRLIRARLSDSVQEQVAMYDELLEAGAPHDSFAAVRGAVPILFLKAKLLDDPSVVDAFFDQFAVGMPPEAGLMLMQLKAAAMPSREEKAKVYDEIFAAYANDPFPDVSREARKSYLSKLALVRGEDDRIAVIDSALRSMNGGVAADMEVFFLLQEKAALLADSQERIAVYDQMAALAEKAGNPALAAAALMEKAELATDPREKAQLYRTVLDRGAGNPQNRTRALLGLAEMEEGEARIALYDQIIDNPDNALDVLYPLDGQLLFEALRRKSRATGRDYVNAYLDARIASGIAAAVGTARIEKARLAENDREKLEQYDLVWREFVDNPYAALQEMAARAANGKLDLLRDAGSKLEFCDEIILRYGDLALEQSTKTELLARALCDKASLTNDAASKAALYERVLSLFEDRISIPPDEAWRDKAIAAKAAMGEASAAQ